MKRLFGVVALVALVAPGIAAAESVRCSAGFTAAPNTGSALPTFAQVTVNGVCLDLSGSIVHEGKISVLPATEVETQFGKITVNATFNADPVVTFGTTTTNLVAGPVTYAFLFGTPIVPGFYNTATSTAGVTVTNGASGTSTVNPSAVFPTYVSAYGTLGAAATNLGVNLGNAPCTAGPGTPSTVTHTCSQGSLKNTFAPTFYDNLEALLTFTQDDVNSVASWSGAVTLTNAVPEPASMVLFAVGVVALAAGSRVRGRRPRV